MPRLAHLVPTLASQVGTVIAQLTESWIGDCIFQTHEQASILSSRYVLSSHAIRGPCSDSRSRCNAANFISHSSPKTNEGERDTHYFSTASSIFFSVLLPAPCPDLESTRRRSGCGFPLSWNWSSAACLNE